MALSCFPKISPKLIIIQAGNGNRGRGWTWGTQDRRHSQDNGSGETSGVCWVKNFVSFNTYTNPRAKPFNGSQKLTNHISTRTRRQGNGGEWRRIVRWSGAGQRERIKL